jgi:hypothetical protein
VRARAVPSLARIIATFGQMRTTLNCILVMLVLAGCSKIETENGPPILVLAVGAEHQPEFKIEGKGLSEGYQTNGNFEFRMRGALGETWIKCVGTVAVARGNNVVITLRTSADRQFDLQLIGLSENDDPSLPEGGLKQTMHIPKGDQEIKLERLVVQTYDFSKG